MKRRVKNTKIKVPNVLKNQKTATTNPQYDFSRGGGAKGEKYSTAASEGERTAVTGREGGAPGRAGPELRAAEAGGAPRWALSLVLKGPGPAGELDLLEWCGTLHLQFLPAASEPKALAWDER